MQTIVVLAVFLGAQFGGWGHEVAASMAFITLCLIQLFHCFNSKSLTGTIFHKDIFKNKFMLLAFGVGCVLTVGVALIPGLNTIFHVVDLNLVQWLVAVFAAATIIPLVEAGKAIARYVHNKNLAAK